MMFMQIYRKGRFGENTKEIGCLNTFWAKAVWKGSPWADAEGQGS